MSKIKVNSLEGVGASTPAITIDNASGTCTANVTNNLSNRNIIVNGAMQLAQKASSSTTSGYETVDRFSWDAFAMGATATQSQSDVAAGTTPYSLGFRKAFKLTLGNNGSPAVSTRVAFEYKIEAQDIANSGWNYTSSSSYITISYWVKSSVSQNFYNTFTTDDGTSQRYVTETGTLTADTWTKITKQISGNSNLTFNNDNQEGLAITWEMFRGTDQTGTRPLNAWAAADNATRTPDQTSTWYTTNGATFEITGVQLEVDHTGSGKPTDFEHRSYAQELTLAQRYLYVAYIKESGHSGKYALPSNVAMWNTTAPYMNMSFPNQMRTTPSLSMFNVSSAIQIPFSSPSTVNVSTLYLSYAHRQGTLLYGSGSGGAGVAGQTSNGYIQSDNLSVGQGIFFSAEL